MGGRNNPSTVLTGSDSPDDDVDTRKRCQVLRALIAMNPRQALSIRAMAVADGKLPELAIALTLEHQLGAAVETEGESGSSSSSSSSTSSSSSPSPARSTMVQNQVILRHQKFTFPRAIE